MEYFRTEFQSLLQLKKAENVFRKTAFKMAFSKLLIFLLFLQMCSYTALAQKSSVQKEHAGDVLLFHDSITTGELKEIHLSDLKGWKFSPKDHPSFSAYDFDDSNWLTISRPLSEEGAVTDSLWKGFGWFRLKVKVDSSQPFFTTKRGTDGTGLGLNITNDIIKAHGGILVINSELGTGSTFTIKLPLNQEKS